MKNYIKPIAATAVLIILGGFGLWFANESSTADVQTEAVVQQVTQEETAPSVVISEDGKTVSYDGLEGNTALEILKAGTEITVKASDFGEFVNGINSVIADENSEFWAFYVNGKLASEGAGTYQTMDGDQIEWKLETF